MEAAIIKPKLPKRAKLRKDFSRLPLFNAQRAPFFQREGKYKVYELKKIQQFVKNFLPARIYRLFQVVADWFYVHEKRQEDTAGNGL